MYGTFGVAWTSCFLHGTESASWSSAKAVPILLVALVVAMAMSAASHCSEQVAYRPTRRTPC